MEPIFSGEVATVKEGLALLALDYNQLPQNFNIKLVKQEGELEVISKDDGAEIRFAKEIHFFRGLGLLLEENAKGKTVFTIRETPQFKSIGAMFDCSRNAVMKLETVKSLLRKMALMGLDTLMLYTEDTYEIPGLPYFGYLRGGYTQGELRALDEYAGKLGIEIVPCIQTLAHLAQALKWEPMALYRDTEDILLADTDATYDLIEKMLKAASDPFRSKRIHLGMDEAHNLGLGRYLDLYGYQNRFQIMLRHLEKVLAIAEKLGLEPMIWSDMFFRLGSKTGDYYDLDSEIPQEVLEKVPQNVRYVYWDYYHLEEDFYEEWIKRHKSLGSEPIFAGGIWTWVGMATNYGRTFTTTNAALTACKKEGVGEVFATLWNDDGGENNYQTALLGLQLFAEHGYSEELSQEKLEARFEFCCGASFQSFWELRLLDEVPGTSTNNPDAFNPSKYILWQDPLLGLFDYQLEGLPLKEHYQKLARDFQHYAQDQSWGFLFSFYQELAQLLAQKVEIGNNLYHTYQNDNREALAQLVHSELPELWEQIKRVRNLHRELWFNNYKPFGWEVLDLRYGGLLARVESAKWRLEEYLAGRVETIAELEEERLSYDGSPKGSLVLANRYRRIATSSSVS